MSSKDDQSIGGSWICDAWDPHLKIFHRLESTLVATESAYQRIEVCETYNFGRMLLIDGVPQAAELDEMVYSRALAWPALLAVHRPKRVLITGGGDGHVLRDVLRFASVVSVVVCDIDPLVTEVTKQYLPFMWAGVEGDGRADVRHEDALTFLAQAPAGAFDVVISDITDPSGDASASHHLYSIDYFELIRRCLSDGGICVAQAQELSVRESAHHQSLRDIARRVFPVVRSAHVYVPSFGYPEGFILAGDAVPSLSVSEVATRLAANSAATDLYFDATVHQAMFALPPILERRLGIRDS
jgi:spermidine synthase